MSLLSPQWLLLALPAGLLVWFTGRIKGPPVWLRFSMVLALVVALARPELRVRSAGSDVVVLVDRSRSMPHGSQGAAEEVIHLLEPQRHTGDRLGVISFGREPAIDMPLSADARFGGFTASVDPEASNLSAAIDAAFDLIPLERSGRVLIISDGRATGLDARAAARRLIARGIPVDVRFLGREDQGVDVAVTALTVPPQVAAKEPFLITATIKATTAASTELTLLRNGKPLVRTTRTLAAGATVLSFRDLIEAPGLAAYELHAETASDSVPENDVGRAVVRVEGPPRVLLVTDKPTGTLAKTLSDAKLELVVRAPFAITMESLDGVGAVILEDVEAGRLSEGGLHVLEQFVKEAGGGLVMTGGHHSFGEGGYRKSPVEELLPVSLELREEQRKAAIAISIVMDCSCSMGVRVPDGRTKMELAAEGVVGALQLLNPRDEASVFMVDTAPHEIFSMSPVAAGLPLDKVARGFSGGGGIYIGVGLETAQREVLRSDKSTRHVLLFADAADSEEPGSYQRTVSELVSKGITVSVIGMGSPGDSDAHLLRDIAARGNGRIYFAEDVTSLPRIFSQETIAVARSTFIETPVATSLGPDLLQLGKLPVSTTPEIGGYNLTYLRPQANVGLRTDDSNAAPIVAFWPRGTGRVVALPAEVDGDFTGNLRSWAGERALLEQVVRWVMPVEAKAIDAVARAQLAGNDLHVTLDFDPHAPPPAGTPTLVLLSGDAHLKPVELPMHWEDDDRVGAHWVLPGSGTWHPVVKLGDRIFRAAPVTLPWAPEFEPAPASEGQRFLQAVAKAGGGLERLAIAGLFGDAVQSEAGVSLAPWLVAMCVLLVIGDVFTRRFLSGPRTRRTAQPTVAVPTLVVEAALPVPATTPTATSTPSQPEPTSAAAPPVVEAKPGVQSALAAARARAKKRTGQ